MPHTATNYALKTLRLTPLSARVILIGVCLVLAGCASPYAGVRVPVGPVSVGAGASNSGVSLGVGTGMGPVGVGVGVNQRGQVSGSAGVGASTRIGNSKAHVGAGVGSSTLLYDPQNNRAMQDASPDAMQPRSAPASSEETVWRDATGHVVPSCKVRGQC